MNLYYNDNMIHKYLYQDNNIYYIIVYDKSDINADNEEEQTNTVLDLSDTEKYITLCKDINFCQFSYDNIKRKLTTEINVENNKYSNVFSLKK